MTKVVGMTLVFLSFWLVQNLLFPSPVFAANSSIFTVSVWVKPTSSIASQALVGKAEELRVFTDASGNLGCQIKSTTWQTASTGTTALTLNAWNHVACAYDKSTLKVYVNGVQANSNNLTATIDDTANAVLVGQDSSASTPYSNLTGTTDDFKFYNYARTQKQIVEDMGGGHPAVYASSTTLSSSSSTGGSRAGGPVGYWKFDEGYGTTAHNSGSQGETLQGSLSGFASPATSTSGWTQAGKFNRGLIFDGTDDVISAGTSSTLDFSSGFTLSAWIYRASTQNSVDSSIVSKIDALTPFNGYMIWYNGNTADLYINGGIRANSTTTLSANTWYHIVGIWDGTNAKIYINGNLDVSSAYSTAPSSSGKTFQIGNYSSARFFTGTIDEVKIYPYALTADEVKLDYNRGAAQVLGALSDKTGTGYESNQSANQEYCIPGDSTSCAAPVGRWDFDENTGSTVYDKSGNNNNGTWNGTLGNQWKPGKNSPGGNFNGSDNYVEKTSAILSTTNGTIEYWMKPNFNTTSLSGSYGLFYSRSTASGSCGGLQNFFNSSTGKLRLSRACEVGLEYTTPSDWQNTWKHITYTYDSSRNTYLYVDGILVASGNYGNSAFTSEAFELGKTDVSTTWKYFPGQIDQVRIFNYARSAAQIAWDYNRGAPVGHWKFDECQGATAHDSSGNSNHGTINLSTTGTQTTAIGMGTCTTNASTPWYNGRTGKFNSSLNFDGTDDYVSVANNSVLNPQYITVSAWVKSNTSTWNENGFIVSKRNVYIIHPNQNATTVGFYISGNGSSWFSRECSPTDITQWNLYTLTYDGTTLKCYVNGVLGNSLNVSGTLYTSDTGELDIGRDDGTSRYGNVQIDDVRIYNYGLTATQVKLLYNQGGAIRYGPATGAP